MATGGIFQLITNDGKQDRLLMATSLLKQRLESVAKVRAKNPRVRDPTPTLKDIEMTHILFMTPHFKPFAAIGYEYNKVQVQAGTATLGSEVTFSIPQFGDFFHDMLLHVKLNQPELTATAPEDSDQPLMRWCHYIGERLMKKVKFEVNGNPLDEYDYHATNMHREFLVQPNKEIGWNRCVGQEIPHEGYWDQPNWVRNGVAPAGVTHRLGLTMSDGNQTPTAQKTDVVELFIPLLFWCNKDPRLAVPSVAIPYGQRFITIELATQSELVGMFPRGSSTWANPGGTMSTTNIVNKIELYINNIFVNPEVHDIFIKKIGFTLIRVHRKQIYNADKATEDILLQQLKWPIETLFVGMKIADYNSSVEETRRQHLDKWYRFSKITPTIRGKDGWYSYRKQVLTGTSVALTAATGAVLGVATLFATEVAVGDVLVIEGGQYSVKTVTDDLNIVVTSVSVADIAPTTEFYLFKKMSQTGTFEVCDPTMDEVSIKAHGIPIYNSFPIRFYNAYTPYHYGGHNIRTPNDCGALMIPFNLYPGTYQPSGHINVSRAREFFLEYTSSVIDSTTRGTLVVIASAINFLLISDGSAVLRYTT
jgi:hypothetical protein